MKNTHADHVIEEGKRARACFHGLLLVSFSFFQSKSERAGGGIQLLDRHSFNLSLSRSRSLFSYYEIDLLSGSRPPPPP